ncbi:DUF6191 domain-containing protein [Blastococcus montanus]
MEQQRARDIVRDDVQDGDPPFGVDLGRGTVRIDRP